ncbi:hypothetical protein [Pseudomonas aeruginosa]|uniref:hypothetical protein n=1 Tax=Pseudomonas aeruginosa TaxID=287 RepID=UPI00070A3CD8|nr:hypothetical protein [Pseudomonas aeruginosa]
MSSWMLILTILGSNGIGVAVHHVPGYATEEQCQRAADKWKADFVHEKINGFRSAVCTEQTSPGAQASATQVDGFHKQLAFIETQLDIRQ